MPDKKDFQKVTTENSGSLSSSQQIKMETKIPSPSNHSRIVTRDNQTNTTKPNNLSVSSKSKQTNSKLPDEKNSQNASATNSRFLSSSQKNKIENKDDPSSSSPKNPKN